MNSLSRLILPCLMVLSLTTQGLEPVPSDAASSAGSVAAGPGSSLSAFGVLIFREGSVTRQPEESPTWLDAPLNGPVDEGDRIRTAKLSQARLELGPGNQVRMAASSSIRLDRLVKDLEERRLEADLVLETGDLWAELDGLEEEDRFSIRSDVLGAAITGTALRMQVAEDGATTLDVQRGSVRAASRPELLWDPDHPVWSIDQWREQQGAPKVVSGPVPVAGPVPVSLEEWVLIVKGGQRLHVDGTGGIVLDQSGQGPQ